MIDHYVYVIIALLPLAALMLVFQANPYHALVIRGILGALATLIYAILGAADVALTEALVGTMLAITLYAIAVRSSLVMRLGIIKSQTEQESYFAELIAKIKKVSNKHYLRLELIEYSNLQALEQALMAKEVHATCTKRVELLGDDTAKSNVEKIYNTTIRVRRLFEIMQTEASLPETTLRYIPISNVENKH